MKKIFYLMAMAITALTFSACSDDDNDIQAEVVIPEETNLMQLERYSYELPFEIKSDSEWKIEFDFEDGQICYAMPDHGTGSQTVKICVIDNPSETRRGGEMFIDFPKDESKNQVIKLQQKSMADDGENAVDLALGNRVYVVGYGYNTLHERASIHSVSISPIINYAQAYADGKVVVGPMDASFVAKTYSGSSVSELSNELSADANFGGMYCGFKGEIGATFDMKDFSKQQNEYAISYVEADMQSAYMEMSPTEIINTYMTDAAYDDINGLPTKGRRHSAPTAYPTTDEGLAKLVQFYGTHLVMSARLGGCLKYVTTVDISKVEGSYDLKAFANCSYKNSFVQASMNVSDNYKQSHASNSQAVQTVVKVQGGSKDAVVKLAVANGDNNANFSAWIESLKDAKNQTLVGLDYGREKLIPLYELVDQSLTLAEDGVDGKARYAALKAYINGDKIETDMSKALGMEYEMGDATHLASIPDFVSESRNQDQSLIKDYYRGGQAVARICHEFVPVIDKTQRVRVIYPILSNKVKYNLGYFAGDATHRPAKVCWSKDGLSVVSLVNEPMGAITELYVRGSNFFNNNNDSIIHALETVDATLQPYIISAPGRDNLHDYPVVKIFNQIWMRDNYQANRSIRGDWHDCKYNDNNNNIRNDAFYSFNEARNSTFAPQGWRVSSKTDFQNIQKTLTANDVSNITTSVAFYPDEKGGVLGFYLRLNGRWDADNTNKFNMDGFVCYYGCLKNDANKSYDDVFQITREGGFAPIDYGWDETHRFAVRLLQDIY
ncbi:MAG: hypothetical protein K6G92_08875 [Bacteroidaceae bacterium]|nr:hypothetical protein [Bacteroidaceae bacterium]